MIDVYIPNDSAKLLVSSSKILSLWKDLTISLGRQAQPSDL